MLATGAGGVLGTTCKRGVAGAAVLVAADCPTVEVPHFSQNFDPAASVAPQPEQKRTVVVAGVSGTRVPQEVQND